MPRNTKLTLPEGEWTELTSGDVASISFEVISGAQVMIAATTGGTEPTGDFAEWFYPCGTGARNEALSDLFPGLPIAKRVWARSAAGLGAISVSHA